MNEKELMLTSLLNCQRHELYLNKNLLDASQRKILSEILCLRAQGMPLQYILGFADFMGLRFNVREGVLIPRPETEILVETAIKIVTSHQSPVTSVKILDVGTGSGCIAVSLAKFIKDAEITAIDISQDALNIAQENAQLNGVADKINFIQSDLFTQYSILDTQYDIIISNPPYICRGKIDDLPKDVKHEPRIALDGGPDGLDFYRRIIRDAPRYLKEDGCLIMEIGMGQVEALEDISQQSGKFEVSQIIKDYNEIERVIVMQIK